MPRSAMICLALIIFLTSSTLAATLEGRVVGPDGEPKTYVRVDISGPQSKSTATDERGVFTAQLEAGNYQVRISEGNRRMQFSVRIRAEMEERTFRVNW